MNIFLLAHFSGIIRHTAEIVALVTLLIGLTIQYAVVRFVLGENLEYYFYGRISLQSASY